MNQLKKFCLISKNEKQQKENIDNAYRYVHENFSLKKFKKEILNTIE